jgi:hypothetical protein
MNLLFRIHRPIIFTYICNVCDALKCNETCKWKFYHLTAVQLDKESVWPFQLSSSEIYQKLLNVLSEEAFCISL